MHTRAGQRELSAADAGNEGLHHPKDFLRKSIT